jgi:ubiquinone/menaquinone biosynthesis C-methylase UbiE
MSPPARDIRLAFAPHVARVIASDLTAEMLVEAAKLAKAKGFANMDTAPADAEALPFEDARFDLVTCRIAPHHFPDIPTFVAEVWRTLKPGGTFALVDNISPDAESTPGFSSTELRVRPSPTTPSRSYATRATHVASAWRNGLRC